METEALIWALGVPQASIWGDRREEERAQELRKGWGWKASPPLPSPPRPVLRGSQPGLWSPGHIRRCGFTVVGHQRPGDLRLVTGCSQWLYPCMTLGHFLGCASISPSVKWNRQNLAPFWKTGTQIR